MDNSDNITAVADRVKTPCYVIDEAKLISNLKILRAVERRAGCKILLAQKAFSMYSLYPLIGRYISGTAASGLHEARLGREEMGRETHVFSPAYSDGDFAQLTELCDHIVFNSYDQWTKFKAKLPPNVSSGLRVNPEHPTASHAIYDPCAPYSRLGATRKTLSDKDLSGIEGLHFHTLCEQNADALHSTLEAAIRKFAELFTTLKWVNLGGGHHITRGDYDTDLLVKCVERAKSAFGVSDVYLEPGEAVALDAGYLVAEVLGVVHNNRKIAVLDASAACHMPDVLEMPYRPEIIGGRERGNYKYRLAGNTCLAGDIIGDYCFGKPLKEGDRLIFKDMAIYTMVKNNTFNGARLPSIAVLRENNELETVREFGYEDFKGRLS